MLKAVEDRSDEGLLSLGFVVVLLRWGSRAAKDLWAERLRKLHQFNVERSLREALARSQGPGNGMLVELLPVQGKVLRSKDQSPTGN
jgi:hypothetical protein